MFTSLDHVKAVELDANDIVLIDTEYVMILSVAALSNEETRIIYSPVGSTKPVCDKIDLYDSMNVMRYTWK